MKIFSPTHALNWSRTRHTTTLPECARIEEEEARAAAEQPEEDLAAAAEVAGGWWMTGADVWRV